MSTDLMEYAESRFARFDERLDNVESKIAELERGAGRLEHAVNQLQTQCAAFSVGLDRIDTSLNRIERRLGLGTRRA